MAIAPFFEVKTADVKVQIWLQLIGCGVDPMSVSSKTGNNALHECVPAHDSIGRKVAEDARYYEAVQILLDVGCNPWLRNHKGTKVPSRPMLPCSFIR